MLNFTTPSGKTGDPSVLFRAGPAGEMELRKTNIMLSSYRGIPRVTQDSALRGSDIMKLVCFGPSLKDTWESVKDGEGDIWTVSGANRYLYQRGITASFHLEADPRPHKAELLVGSSPDTVYLIASRCHEEVFKALKGKRGLMYHMSGGEEDPVIEEYFPGEFKVPPAWTMGNTALNIGLLLGYRKFRIWAMDGSYGEGGIQHPEDHPNEDPVYQVYTVDGGRKFLSSPSHMVAAECFIKVMQHWPYGTFEFVGDGMIPHMYERYTKDYRN